MEKDFLKAAKQGDAAKIRELLTADPKLISCRDSEHSTALHHASWKGYVEVVAILLDAGADISARNKVGHWGTTPLHAAAHGNHNKVVALLIERGADINALDDEGRTPLFHTTFHNASAARKVLLANGAV